jgi:hypothetical protein
MSWSSESVGLVLHAVDMSCGQTCTHAMVSLSVNWWQKTEATGHDTVRATSIVKSWDSQVGTQELYAIHITMLQLVVKFSSTPYVSF